MIHIDGPIPPEPVNALPIVYGARDIDRLDVRQIDGMIAIHIDTRNLRMLHLAHDAVMFSKWLMRFCNTVLACAQEMVGRTAVINNLALEAHVARCRCPEEHWLLVGIQVDLARDPLFQADSGAVDPEKVIDFLNSWSHQYERLMDELPNVEGGIIRKIFNRPHPVPVRETFFHLNVKEVELPEATDDHTEAFMDFARRGDEAGFKDLARMALQNLTPDDIDEMWTGTLLRLRTKKE
jgi:hypothetical protein